MDNRSTATISNDTDQLKADVAKLRQDLTHLMTATADLGRDTVAVANDKVRAGMRAARQKGTEGAELLSQSIEERPVASVLIAFGLGVLAAKLMERRA